MTTVIVPGNGLESIAYGDATAERQDLRVKAAAIGIQVKGTLLNDSAVDDAWALLKEMWAYESPFRLARVAVTGTDPPATSSEIYDASAYNKLMDTRYGIPHVLIDDVGESTDIEARQYARKLLMNAAKLAARRTYRCEADLPAALPEKGDVCTMPDGFTGVCIGFTYEINEGAETLTLELLNLNTAGY